MCNENKFKLYPKRASVLIVPTPLDRINVGSISAVIQIQIKKREKIIKNT